MLQISESKDRRCTGLLMPVLSAIYSDSWLESAIRDWSDDFQSNGTLAIVHAFFVVNAKKSRSVIEVAVFVFRFTVALAFARAKDAKLINQLSLQFSFQFCNI